MITRSAASVGRKSTRARENLRARVASAFREVAGGVNEQEAGNRTLDFYRSRGTDWARSLA